MITRIKKVLSDKQRLRKELLEKLRTQKPGDILKKSREIKRKLFELKEFREAGCVAFFVSMPTEVSTHEMIDKSMRMGKRVGVPAVAPAGQKGKKLVFSQITDRRKQLMKGPLGIRQPRPGHMMPVPPSAMDLVLVPGVAFDRKGNRLGRGKGYYDRFLKKLPKEALTVGLCFDFQVKRSVPTLPHDIPVRMLLTN